MFIEISLKRPRPHVKRCALIVDGDPDLRKSLAKQLERIDFDVLSTNHYEGGVQCLATHDFHFVCVDVQLPNRSGYELCEHMRTALGLGTLPILMMSEYGTPEDLAYAESAGANAFLCKPFSMREFTDCVESLLTATRWTAPSIHELQPLVARRRLTGIASRIRSP
jgi:two-component system chemotaxis response regulator CheY